MCIRNKGVRIIHTLLTEANNLKLEKTYILFVIENSSQLKTVNVEAGNNNGRLII